MHSLVLTIILIFTSILTFSQSNIGIPKGKFSGDSVKIGAYIDYSISIEYPEHQKVLVPDSGYNFFPFEFVKKRYYPTIKSNNGNLKDSIIYTLATFELDSVYYLSLPVFIIEESDCVTYYSNADEVLLKPVVTEIPEDPALFTDTSYANVPTQFNYIYFLIGFGGVVIILVTLGIIFGKKVYQSFVVYRLKKSYEKFKVNFNHSIATERKENLNEMTERSLNIWKKYLEKLDRKPITTLTTKEIIRLYQDDNLNINLKELDRSLYGGFQLKNVNEVFTSLEEFSLQRLNLKIEEVKNG